MKNSFLAVILLLVLRLPTLAQTTASPQTASPQTGAPPQADISNGVLHARLYLPDSVNGYYRATRFDWSGVMPLLEYKGRNYCTQWFPKYAPTINDAVTGPVESFDPIGYQQALPGGSFVKIGVGSLTKPDPAPYSPFKYYPIRDIGIWRVKHSKKAMVFQQRLDDSAYSYVYTKKVSLPKGKSQLTLSHTLKNTGKAIIETDVFDHNFFRVDSQFTVPGLVTKFRFAVTATEARGINDIAEIRGDSIVILRPLVGRENVYAILHGYGDQPADYDIRLENHVTGMGVHIVADRPLSKLAYWGSATILCPEPFIHVRVPPGESFSWIIRYEFYNLSDEK